MAKIFYIRTMVTIILIIFANIRRICVVLCYLIFGCEIECTSFVVWVSKCSKTLQCPNKLGVKMVSLWNIQRSFDTRRSQIFAFVIKLHVEMFTFRNSVDSVRARIFRQQHHWRMYTFHIERQRETPMLKLKGTNHRDLDCTHCTRRRAYIMRHQFGFYVNEFWVWIGWKE